VKVTVDAEEEFQEAQLNPLLILEIVIKVLLPQNEPYQEEQLEAEFNLSSNYTVP